MKFKLKNFSSNTLVSALVFALSAGTVLAANGDRDTTFNSAGANQGLNTTSFNPGNSDIANALAIQSDGKIVSCGGVRPVSTEDIGAVRYNANGTLDTSFGNTTPAPDGKFSIAPSASRTDRCTGVAIQSDGKIILAGYSSIAAGNDQVFVARLNTNGTLDTTFNAPTGYVLTDIQSIEFGSAVATDRTSGVALQTVGGQTKIVVSATTFGSLTDFAVLRYNSDGTLDSSFDGNGIVVTGFSGADSANAIAVTSDNKIVVAGYDNNTDFAVVRYNTNGSLDTTFNGTGKLTTDFGSTSDQATAVAVQSNGKITVGGSTLSASTNVDFAMARYNSDGSLDSTFGSGGKVITPITAGTASDNILGLAIQADGKIVAVGTSGSSKLDAAIVRYNAGGTLDGTFATGGVAKISFGNNTDSAKAVKLDAAGKIVIAGGANLGSVGGFQNDDLLVARFISGSVAPTAATVSIGGRVTDASGRGLLGATVSLLDSEGKMRAARTNSFGYFRFSDVQTGSTYILNVQSKGNQFAPQVVSVSDELTDVNFTGLQ